jgi:hypothetical protein
MRLLTLGLVLLALFMSQKFKHIKNHPDPKPQKDGGEEKSTNRHVYIEPGTKIDFVEDLRKKYDTAQGDDSTHKTQQIFWTKVASVLLLLTAGFTGWQVKIARDTYYASQRPFVGANGIQPIYISFDSDGTPKITNAPTEKTTRLSFRAEIRNFGPVPGMNFKSDWKVSLGGVVEKGDKIPDHPHTIFPGQSVFLTGSVGGNPYLSLMKGEKTLEIEIRDEYDGAKHYTECQKYQYAPDVNGFWNLGACTP